MASVFSAALAFVWLFRSLGAGGRRRTSPRPRPCSRPLLVAFACRRRRRRGRRLLFGMGGASSFFFATPRRSLRRLWERPVVASLFFGPSARSFQSGLFGSIGRARLWHFFFRLSGLRGFCLRLAPKPPALETAPGPQFPHPVPPTLLPQPSPRRRRCRRVLADAAAADALAARVSSEALGKNGFCVSFFAHLARAVAAAGAGRRRRR